MIEKNEFLEGIGKIANMTNTEPPKAIGTWYEKVKHWSKEDWEAACDACASELKWFPKFAEIFERKPRQYSTGVVKQSAQWDTPKPPERGPDDLENKIDNLTDDEIIWLFHQDNMERSAKFSIKRFRKDPDSKIYREVIRNLVKKFQYEKRI